MDQKINANERIEALKAEARDLRDQLAAEFGGNAGSDFAQIAA